MSVSQNYLILPTAGYSTCSDKWRPDMWHSTGCVLPLPVSWACQLQAALFCYLMTTIITMSHFYRRLHVAGVVRHSSSCSAISRIWNLSIALTRIIIIALLNFPKSHSLFPNLTLPQTVSHIHESENFNGLLSLTLVCLASFLINFQHWSVNMVLVTILVSIFLSYLASLPFVTTLLYEVAVCY